MRSLEFKIQHFYSKIKKYDKKKYKKNGLRDN